MGEVVPFPAFGKIPRLNRTMVITEKIDGTNGLVSVSADKSEVRAGSRNRWITPEADNFGFAAWVQKNEDDLRRLGPGNHHGEWYGSGIQRHYGLDHKRFALFNVAKFEDNRPECCDVVPTLAYANTASELADIIEDQLWRLRKYGSRAVPGFMEPEGLVAYHAAARQLFKVTLDNDQAPKTAA